MVCRNCNRRLRVGNPGISTFKGDPVSQAPTYQGEYIEDGEVMWLYGCDAPGLPLLHEPMDKILEWAEGLA